MPFAVNAFAVNAFAVNAFAVNAFAVNVCEADSRVPIARDQDR